MTKIQASLLGLSVLAGSKGFVSQPKATPRPITKLSSVNSDDLRNDSFNKTEGGFLSDQEITPILFELAERNGFEAGNVTQKSFTEEFLEAKMKRRQNIKSPIERLGFLINKMKEVRKAIQSSKAFQKLGFQKRLLQLLEREVRKTIGKLGQISENNSTNTTSQTNATLSDPFAEKDALIQWALSDDIDSNKNETFNEQDLMDQYDQFLKDIGITRRPKKRGENSENLQNETKIPSDEEIYNSIIELQRQYARIVFDIQTQDVGILNTTDPNTTAWN